VKQSVVTLASPLLFLLGYKRKRSKKKIPNKSDGSAGFVDSYTLLTQSATKLCGAGFYATPQVVG